MNLQKCSFIDCSLVSVDFAEANLSGVDFGKSNLSDTIFEQTNLEKTDLSKSNFARTAGDKFLNLLESFLPKTGKVLDFACGTGHVVKSLIERAVGADLDQLSVDLIRDTFHQYFV